MYCTMFYLVLKSEQPLSFSLEINWCNQSMNKDNAIIPTATAEIRKKHDNKSEINWPISPETSEHKQNERYDFCVNNQSINQSFNVC